MANRQIYQLTSQSLSLDSYIPIQDSNGTTEAKVTFIRNIASLITASIDNIFNTTTDVLKVPLISSPSIRIGSIYSINPLTPQLSNQFTPNIFGAIIIGSGSMNGAGYNTAYSKIIGAEAGAVGQSGTGSDAGGRIGLGRKVFYNNHHRGYYTISFGRETSIDSFNCILSTFMGFRAGGKITTPSGITTYTAFATQRKFGAPESTAFGYNTAYSASTDGFFYNANDNNSATRNELVAFGQAAGFKNFGSCIPVFIGSGAGAFSNRSYGSVFIGNKAGYANPSFNQNLATARYATFLGTNIGAGAYGGDHNILIGFNIESGSFELPIGNIVIGKNINAPYPYIGDGAMNLGGVIYAGGMNTRYVSGNIGLQTPVPARNNPRVGIAQHNPQHTLDVSGSVRIINNVIFNNLPRCANDSAAAAVGLPIGYLYRNGNVVSIRVN